MPEAGAARPVVEEGGDWDFVPDVVVRDGDAIDGGEMAVRGGAHAGPYLEPSVLCAARCRHPVQRRSCDGLVDQRHRPARRRHGGLHGLARQAAVAPDTVYWPTHGPAITEPQRHVRAFIAHRREREAGIVDCLKSGIETIDAMVERLYVGLNPALRRAAGRSVLAHLIDLIGRDIVAADGPADGRRALSLAPFLALNPSTPPAGRRRVRRREKAAPLQQPSGMSNSPL